MIKYYYKMIVPERKRIRLRIWLRQLMHVFYLGNRFKCNCCNKTFRKFLPKGRQKRKNAVCPYCGSLERTRLLDLYLSNEYEIHKQKKTKLLHFAPEDCLSKKLSTLEIEYTDGDINPAVARNRIDIMDIHYEDNYFDLIICAHVLAHVTDEKKAISELFRVLSPKGQALILTLIPRDLEQTIELNDKQLIDEKLFWYMDIDLLRLHGADFGNKLERQGFVVQKIDYRKKLSADVIVKNSLGNGEREIIYLCKKQ